MLAVEGKSRENDFRSFECTIDIEQWSEFQQIQWLSNLLIKFKQLDYRGRFSGVFLNSKLDTYGFGGHRTLRR